LKLQLLYDFLSPPDNDGDYVDEDVGYASNSYTNSKLPHEHTNFHSSLFSRMSKYFKSINRYATISLVEVPDDVMFQYMIENVFDYDYVSYDMFQHRICISNSKYESTRYGRESYGYATASNSSSYANGNIFTFGHEHNSELEKTQDERKTYCIVPDAEHYSNILEVLRPHVVYEFARWFKEGARIIGETQDLGIISYSDDPVGDYGYNSVKNSGRIFLDNEKGSTETFNLRYDQFSTCMDFWMNDHVLFTEARQFISDLEVEAYRALYAMIHTEITETK